MLLLCVVECRCNPSPLACFFGLSRLYCTCIPPLHLSHRILSIVPYLSLNPCIDLYLSSHFAADRSTVSRCISHCGRSRRPEAPACKRSTRDTHTPTENNTPDTDTDTHTTRTTLQTNTSHKHLTTLEGGATTVRVNTRENTSARADPISLSLYICIDMSTYIYAYILYIYIYVYYSRREHEMEHISSGWPDLSLSHFKYI